MLNVDEVIRELDKTLKVYDTMKFSSITDIVRFNERMQSEVASVQRMFHDLKYLTGKLEIVDKATVRLVVKGAYDTIKMFQSTNVTFKYGKDFKVFSRGRRNTRLSCKIEKADYDDAILCACQRICEGPWYLIPRTLFQHMKIVNEKLVMTKEQRQFVDKVRNMTWNEIPLSVVRDSLIRMLVEGTDKPSKNIPLDTVSTMMNQSSVVEQNTVRTTVTKPETIPNTCRLCKKWIASRNDGNSLLSIASCPVQGCKTKATDCCGNFRHV